MKDKDGTLLTGDDEVMDRWLGHFNDLLNVENDREDLEGILPVQGPIEDIYLEGVITSVSGLAKQVAGHQGLQLQKVVGPDEKL